MLDPSTNPTGQPDEDLLAMLGLHPAQMAVAHGLASGAIHPQHILNATTPRPTADLSAGPPAPGLIASPDAGPPPIAPPVAAPAGNPKLDADRAELARKESTGSGVDQFRKNHPILGTIAKIAGGIGSAMFPAIGAAIPGTDLHHQVLLNQDRAKVGEDLGQEKEQAQITNLNAQPEIKQNALDLKERQLNETQEKNTNQLSAQYRKLGLKQGPGGEIQPISYEEMNPTEQAVHDLRESQKEAADARTELDKAKSDPNSPLYQAQAKRLQIAEQNSKNAASRLQLSNAEFGNKLQEQNLVKPSGQAQSRASAAEAVMHVMPDLEQMVRSNAKEMGPIMGRLNRGEIAIGDVDPKVAQLYSAMKSFYALQPAVHGFRNSEFVKDFESAIGTLERDPNAFLAGMHGLEPTMKAIANEGKTFHKRIVEGDESTAPPKTPDKSNDPLGIR